MRESLKMPTIACPQQGTTETILTSEMTIWKLSDLVFCFIVLATLFGLTAKRIGHERPRVGGGVLGSSFAGYVSLASQNPHPIIVYSVANYRPHLSHFWANVIVISKTEFNMRRLLNIKTTVGTIF